jgi:hypothetical protein
MTGNAVALWPSARYEGAAERRVVCPAALPINIGGGFAQRHAFKPEGALRRDNQQIQI